jgi:hypothetical protein
MEKKSIDLLELLSKLIVEKKQIDLLKLLSKLVKEKSTAGREENE